jgi:hypothetical protein
MTTHIIIDSGDRAETASEKEFKRMVANDMEEAYVNSKIAEELFWGARKSVPSGYRNRKCSALLGFHEIGKLAIEEAVPTVQLPSAPYTNLEQHILNLSKGAFAPDLPSRSSSPDGKVEPLRRQVEGLKIAELSSPMSRCDSFSESQSSCSSHQRDASIERRHPDEHLGFLDNDNFGIEELMGFRTNRLRLQIYGILRAKMDKGEIRRCDYYALSQ